VQDSGSCVATYRHRHTWALALLALASKNFQAFSKVAVIIYSNNPENFIIATLNALLIQLCS